MLQVYVWTIYIFSCSPIGTKQFTKCCVLRIVNAIATFGISPLLRFDFNIKSPNHHKFSFFLTHSLHSLPYKIHANTNGDVCCCCRSLPRFDSVRMSNEWDFEWVLKWRLWAFFENLLLLCFFLFRFPKASLNFSISMLFEQITEDFFISFN